MTVEERAREVFFSMDQLIEAKYRKIVIEALEQMLRDQIEDCAKKADEAIERVQSRNQFGDGMRSIAGAIANNIRDIAEPTENNQEAEKIANRFECGGFFFP